MFTRFHSKALLAGLALAMMPTLAQGQIFSDTEFLSADYDSNTNVAANSTIDFNVDYSSINRFSGFLSVSLPEAPNTPSGATATTGVFLTANDDSLNTASGTETFSAIMPKTSNVNVGTGTATPNYKVTIDVYHSSAAGFDDGTGSLTQTGSTNYSVVGLNQANTTVQLQENNTGGAGAGGLTGQGLSLAITADGGSSDDYLPLYAGARYADRNFGSEAGQFYTGDANDATRAVNTGLLGRHLNDYWENNGFEFTDTDSDPTNNLNRTTGNATHYAPDPNDLANYYTIPAGETDPVLTSVVQPAADEFAVHSDPLHYTCGGSNCGLTGAQTLAGNDGLGAGVPYNAWATHELYWVDGEFTYVIDDVPVLQITPDNDGVGGDDNIFDDYSDAGSVLLGFWDRFGGSISINPEGANFVVFDNLVVDAAASGDAPVMLEYLASAGYLLSTGGDADADGDGDVDGSDFLKLQRDNPAGIAGWAAAYPGAASVANAVPEPSSAILLVGLSLGMLSRRRR